MMSHLSYNPCLLKDMAVRRLVPVLVKESTILASFSNFQLKYYPSQEVWQEIVEDKFLNIISNLRLPKSLTKLLIDTSKPMLQQIVTWAEFHEVYLLYDSREERLLLKRFCFDVPTSEKLHWTTTGAVDYRKTAEELVRSDDFDILERYLFACLYCMEDYIKIFWKELPEEKKEYFYSKEERRLRSGGLGLEFWWPYIIEGQVPNVDELTRSYRRDQITFHQHAFHCSAEKGNRTAAEYFFQKLTQEEKGASLMSVTTNLLLDQYATLNPLDELFPWDKRSELLSYLLSAMTPDQQIEIFQKHPYGVLKRFLVWPLQDFLSHNEDLIKDFIPETKYNSVLRCIHTVFKDSGDYYLKLFKEFYNCIPLGFWNSFMDEQCEFYSHFCGILLSADIKALETFLRSVGAADRARLLFSKVAISFFYLYIYRGELDVVKVSLREANLSDKDTERLKEVFLAHHTSFTEGEKKLTERNVSKFFRLLDGAKDISKRCSEDEALLTEAKRRKF